MKYVILFCVLITFRGVTHAQEEKVEAPQIAIRIGLGETIDLQGTMITFAEVLEDSRCPRTVQCVWAGRARVKVIVEDSRGNLVEKEFIFGQTKPNELKDMLIIEQEEYTIEAINVIPYPQESGEDLEYSLLVRKVKKED
jgi:hypothetical protein